MATAPLMARVDTLEREKSIAGDAITEYRRAIDALTGDVAALKAAQPQVDVIAAKAASLVPTPKDGKDAAPVDVSEIVTKAVALIQPPRDGRDAPPVDVDAIVAKAVALIGKPKDGKDGKDAPVVDLDVVAMKAAALIPKPNDGKDAPAVDVEALAVKVAALMPQPVDVDVVAMKAAALVKPPKDADPVDLDVVAMKAAALIPRPKDGKDATVDLDALAKQAAALVPPPKDGKDGEPIDERIVQVMVVDEVTKRIKDGALIGPMGPTGPKGDRGDQGSQGEQGADGRDGASVDVEQVRAIIAQEVQKAAALLPRPKDGVGIESAVIDHEGVLLLGMTDGTTKSLGAVVGKPGRDGLPGVPGRSGADGLDGKPGAPGKDGKNGIDGRDGIGFDDFDLVIDEATKAAVIRFRKGSVVKDYPLPIPLHWGVYSDAETYRKGNVVTRGGSSWLAMLDTVKGIRPDDKTDDGQRAWRLIVQRGKPGTEGRPGPQGNPGRDLRWEDRG